MLKNIARTSKKKREHGFAVRETAELLVADMDTA